MTRLSGRAMSDWFGHAAARDEGIGEIMTDNTPAPKQGLLRRVWNFLWSPNARLPFLLVLIAGGIGGVLFWGGFNWAMELTNTEAFCIGCHEMRDNPYKELQQTIHFKNRSGVRAICSDCHVPHEWFAKIV